MVPLLSVLLSVELYAVSMVSIIKKNGIRSIIYSISDTVLSARCQTFHRLYSMSYLY